MVEAARRLGGEAGLTHVRLGSTGWRRQSCCSRWRCSSRSSSSEVRCNDRPGVCTLVMPLASGVVGVIAIVVVVLPLAALVYELLGRGNRRQDEVDAEREQVAEEIGLREPIDFESDLRPPREPSASMPGSANGDRATRWHRPASRRYGLAGRHRLVALEAVRLQQLQIGRTTSPRARPRLPGPTWSRRGGGFAVAQGVRTDLRLTFVGLVGRQGLTALLAGG